jgi:competence protein ComEA
MIPRFAPLFLCLAAAFAANAQTKLPDGPGKNTLEKLCVACHSVDVVTEHRFTQEGWVEKLGEMVENGAKATDDELNQILNYLVTNFLEDGKVNINKAPAHEIEKQLEIAEKDAAAIVRFREQHGSFKIFDDLKKVSGVDVKKLEAKKDRLAF